MSTKNTKKKTGKNAKKKMKVFHNSPEKKDEAFQKTGNILSQILSADDISSQDTGNVDDNASAVTFYTETHTEPFINLENFPTKPNDDSNQRTSIPIKASTPIRTSTPITSIQIDDKYSNFKKYDERYLTIKKFNYTIKVLDEKITSLY
ncbi:hypothetical protein C1646_766272 [Rhizophagus diaphanus]|nr:hypothetical protein C1646_766272 [Rhizophagus diaphanus] [Rhizophagus sp. MUCL 43196]